MSGDDGLRHYMDYGDDEDWMVGAVALGAAMGGAFLLGVGVTVAAGIIGGIIGGA